MALAVKFSYRYRNGTSKIAYRPVKYFIKYVISVSVIFAALFGSSSLVATPGSAQLIFGPPSNVLVVGSDQKIPVTWDLPTVNPGTPSFLCWVRWRLGTEYGGNALENGTDYEVE